MKALQQLVEGTGPAVAPYITADVRELLYRAMHHPNRFVRETAHFTATSMCEALAGPELLEIGQDLAERLADGLSDNWSQVRRGWWLLVIGSRHAVNDDLHTRCLKVA